MPRTSEERTVTEQQFQREVNAAIADTENEIFTEAMGEEQLDNDGDNSLEEMGEGLEGEELDEEDVQEEVDTEVDEDADEELEDDDEDDLRDQDDGDEGRRDRDRDDRSRDRTRHEARAREEDERVDQRRRQREDRGDDDDRREVRGREYDRDDRDQRRGVPPWRQRQEADRRRQAQGEAEDLRRELAIANARINDLNLRVNAGPGPEKRQDVEPDMFADPEGWKAWNRRQVADEAARIADQRIQGYRQETQQQANDRVNASFHAAATRPGLAGLEFNAAYQTLTSLDPQDPRNRATVQAIFHAPDPAGALADWFEREGYAGEFREDIARDLGGGRREQRRSRERDRDEDYREREPDTRRRDPRGRYDREDDRGRGREQPRHEFRRRFVPSLNGAAGGGSGNRINDPEMLDNSDDSVFRFATR